VLPLSTGAAGAWLLLVETEAVPLGVLERDTLDEKLADVVAV